jgi:hypothetical protein
VTVDSIPNALRTLLAVVPYQMLTALGFYEVLKIFKQKKIIYWTIAVISVSIFSISFKGYLNNYYNVYPKLYSRDWQYGYNQVVGYIKDNYKDYDMIVFSRAYGEPHMFTLLFLNWDPDRHQNDPNLNRYEAYQWVWVSKFDKFYFPDLGDTGTHYQDIINANSDKKILFIGKPGDFPENLPKLLKVNFLNGVGAFEIVAKNAR